MDSEAQEWLDRNFTDLDLSVRASNGLEQLGLRTVRDICVCSQIELLSSRAIGETCLLEIKTRLDEIGLRLGMTTRDLGMDEADDDN